jgi:hypothetical protein
VFTLALINVLVKPRDTVFVRPQCDPNLQKKLIHPNALADHVWSVRLLASWAVSRSNPGLHTSFGYLGPVKRT